MAWNENKNLKRYFTIKEVAQRLDITESNMEQIKLIYNLVKIRGFKIAAAKKMLSANRTGVEKKAVVLEKLMAVRDELQAMKHHLDGMV